MEQLLCGHTRILRGTTVVNPCHDHQQIIRLISVTV